MLVDEPKVLAAERDPILAMIAKLNGREPGAKQLATGIYEIGSHGSSHFLREYEHTDYGVCDDVQQILDRHHEFKRQDAHHVVTVTRVRRADQPADGGWRWHKWGEYIGKHEPRCEYLHDEEGIDEVLCYQIYERLL